ncbi:MAG TPA: hypothetical protein VFJ14_02635 [Nocardioidaceae bacterium]|nr:hypothetical protein [Nocardioidaceae bacterium]
MTTPVMALALVLMHPALVLMHLGPLHAGEAYAMTALALAPFVLLAIVITVVSRRDRRAERRRDDSRNP